VEALLQLQQSPGIILAHDHEHYMLGMVASSKYPYFVMIRFVFGNAPLRSLPEVLCLWADELHDRVCRNIKHLAEQIQRGNWAS
jgi:hypothetical protein